MAKLANPNEMPRTRDLQRDSDGHRTLTAVYRVQVAQNEGPLRALYCPGLPIPGRMYEMDLDVDPWMYATFKTSVSPAEGEKGRIKYYDVSQEFTTRPFVNETGVGWPGTGASGGGGGGPQDQSQRCNEQDIQNPLLEPLKISGGSVTYTQQGLRDRFDKPIQNSAHQLFEGPKNEWDNHRSQIRVEQNWPVLELDFCDSMVDCVNPDIIWGFPKRAVKLSKFDWRLNRWGLCYFYFTRMFDFDIWCIPDPAAGTGPGLVQLVGGWDRRIKDVGTKALRGFWEKGNYVLLPTRLDGGGIHWPDHNNPNDFIAALDVNNNPFELTLNGKGLPANVKYKLKGDPDSELQDTGPAYYFTVEYYREANFALLGL